MLIAILVLCAVLCAGLIVLIILLGIQLHRQDKDASMLRQEQLRVQRNDEQMNKTFTALNQQLQMLNKEQALHTQSLSQVEQGIRSMNQVMTNTKMRGNWGEYQLNALLEIYAGENPEVFGTQFMLDNGKIADAVLHLPGTDQILCIDSKFPMENYLRLSEEGVDEESVLRAFKSNMKKHIDDVAAKYITPQTADTAVLFIPGEAVYQFVCASCEDILNYALNKHVLLTSPTTLVGVIFTLLAGTRDYYRSRNIKEIEKNILALQADAKRLTERCEKVEKTLETAAAQMHQVNISAHKVYTRMDRMAQGKEDIDEIDG